MPQYDLRRYNNVTTSCQLNADQAFCDNAAVLTTDLETAAKYLEVIAYELYRAPAATFEDNLPGIIDLLDFDPRKGTVSYTETNQV